VDAYAELREYLGHHWDPVRAARPAECLAEDWRRCEPRSEAEILDWYRQAQGYLYDLTAWHQRPERRQWTEQLLRYAERLGARTILDYGCGIGEDGLALLEAGYEVTFADLECPALDYLRWRLRRHGMDAEVVTLRTGLDLRGCWDLGLCLDVLEHVPQPHHTLTLLSAACDALVLTQPGPSPEHPQHLLSVPLDVRRFGLVRVGAAEPPLYRRCP